MDEDTVELAKLDERSINSTSLTDHDDVYKTPSPAPARKPEKRRIMHASEIVCLIVAVGVFIASFLFILIIIPISLRIEDKAAVNASLVTTGASTSANTDITSVAVVLARVDALWHWEAIVSTTSSKTFNLYLVQEIVRSWTNYTTTIGGGSGGHTVYALAGSVVSLAHNEQGQFTVYSTIDTSSVLCSQCSSYAITNDGFYTITSTNSNTSVAIQLMAINTTSTLLTNDQLMCTVGGQVSRCELVFDKITPYYVIANTTFSTDGSGNSIVNMSISEKGRDSWYSVLILLFIPIIGAAIGLIVTIICIRFKCCCCC